MQSSLYLLRVQYCNNKINNNNCGIKNDSYQRYLLKLRGVRNNNITPSGCNITKKI
jgi:hypothetical protein